MILKYTGESNGSFKNGGTYYFDTVKKVITNRDDYGVRVDSVNLEDFRSFIVPVNTNHGTLTELLKKF